MGQGDKNVANSAWDVVVKDLEFNENGKRKLILLFMLCPPRVANDTGIERNDPDQK